MPKLIINTSKTKNLFSCLAGDDFYKEIRKGTTAWHDAAKIYWQQLYNQHNHLLDKDFVQKFPKESLSRLWELTQVNYIGQHISKGIQHIRLTGKASKPDFCFEIDNKRFYIEAVCGSPGNRSNLSVPIEKLSGEVRAIPVTEYKESLCAALKEKGLIMYYGKKSSGYKDYMHEDDGLIIAVSMAKIPLHNLPRNVAHDISCLFGLSDMKIPILNENNTHIMGKPYYEHQPGFSKTSNTSWSLIDTDYFTNNKFSHISAVLISSCVQALFPDIDKFNESCCWGTSRNDFLLIHNPFANVPLPRYFFSVWQEVDAEVKGGMIRIIKEVYS